MSARPKRGAQKKVAVDETPRPMATPSVPDTGAYEQILTKNDASDLDAYLALEFPYDTQGILAKYLKDSFPQAKTPAQMKSEIDNVDDAVKAYYWLTFFRATIQGTVFSSNQSGETTLDDFKKDDFNATNGQSQEKVQNYVGKRLTLVGAAGAWPAPKDEPKKPFVFDLNLSKAIYEQTVSPLVKANYQTWAAIRQRLGMNYGLKRRSSDSTNEALGNTLFRFALFGQNADKLYYEQSDLNTDTIKIVDLKLFQNPQFPEKLSAIMKKFIENGLRTKPKKNDANSESTKETLMSDQTAQQQPAENVQAPTVATEQTVPAEQPAPAVDLAAQAAAALATTAVEESDSKCENVKKAASDAESKMNALIASIDNYAVQSSTASDIIRKQDMLIQQLITLKGQHTALEASSAAVQTDLLKCQADKQALEQRVADSEAKIAELNAQIAALQKKEQDLRATSQQILDQINTYESKVDEIVTLTEQIALQLAEFDVADDAKAVKFTELQASLERRRAEIEKRLNDLKGEGVSVGAERDAANKECEDKQKELRDQLEKALLLQGQLDNVNTREATLQKELETCRDRSDKLKASFSEFCTEQQGYFGKLNSLLDQVSSKVTGAVDSLSKLVEEQKAKIDGYSAKVSQEAASQASQ